MRKMHQQATAEGKSAADMARAIDDSYPYSERSGWAYKAWLDARRDFFRKYQLPLRRARQPKTDLFS